MPDINEYMAECPKCGIRYNKARCNNRCPQCGYKEPAYILKGVLYVAIPIATIVLCVLFLSQNNSKVLDFFGINNEPVTINYEMYYSQLNDTEKKIYETLEKRVGDLPISINIPQASNQEIERAIEAFKYTNPQYFWLNDIQYGYDSVYFIRQYYIKPRYSQSISTNIKNIKYITDEIVKLDLGDKDVDIIKNVYDLIINNTTYDINISENGQDICSVLLNRESVCSGYANTFAYLMQKLGYECYVVTGKSKTNISIDNHAWNLLRLEDELYWIDVTWGETIDQFGNEHEPNYNYFMKKDDEFLFDHYPNNRFLYPSCR